MDSLIARRTWRTLEPYHAAIYFVTEAADEYRRAGIDDRMAGYFASRSAAMGSVPAAVVVATFFNFEPGFVARCMDGVWERATPTEVLAARSRAADRMIRRLAPDAVSGGDVIEAADLARRAAEVAGEHPEGRPLFAGHAALPWPEEPHLALWHAQTLLREFRGDGHVAALTVEGLTGCEALVTHAAAGDVPATVLRSSRRRSDDEWKAAVEALRGRGWLDAGGALTEVGRERRQAIESRTDELATAPYAALGEQACERLRALVRPASRTLASTFG